MKLHKVVLFSCILACVAACVMLNSCASTWRTVGASPAQDLEDHRAEEKKTLREVVDVLVDAMNKRIPPYEVRSRVASILNKQDNEWVNRPDPEPIFPWAEVITAIMAGATGTTAIGVKLLNDHRNRTRQNALQVRDESIAETDKWVAEIEKNTGGTP